MEFCHPNCISKAEKSRKLIANSLQSILGCNVKIKINHVPCASKSRHTKVKKQSFRLFSCCRNVRKSQLSTECESDSDYSEYTSERPMISERSTRPFSDDSGLQIPHKCCHRMDIVRTLGNGEGNVLSTGTVSSLRSLEDSITPELVAASSKVLGSNHEGNVLSFQEPEYQPNCFARTFRLHRKSRSSDTSQMVCCTESQIQNKLALSVIRKASSETSVTTNDTNNTYTNSSGDENG